MLWVALFIIIIIIIIIIVIIIIMLAMIPCIHILNFYVKIESSANSVWEGKCQRKIGRLYNRGRISVGTNLGKHSLFVWLFVSGIKTVTRRIIRQDELSSVVRRSSCTTGETFQDA